MEEVWGRGMMIEQTKEVGNNKGGRRERDKDMKGIKEMKTEISLSIIFDAHVC
jgi:hypothetical protein